MIESVIAAVGQTFAPSVLLHYHYKRSGACREIQLGENMEQLSLSNKELETMNPRDLRRKISKGEWRGRTPLVCSGYAQANLVILPKEMAYDFTLFCNRNPRPCPLIEVTEPGNPHPSFLAEDADLRVVLPKYRVYQEGELIAEPDHIMDYWRDELVCFLLGCSMSFEWALRAAGIKFRLLGIYSTTIPCIPAGDFRGNMVVSCRLFKGAHDTVRAIQISSRYPLFHGPPVHIGDPAAIGIKDLYHADMSAHIHRTLSPQEPDEIPLFWGCGATPQLVARQAKVPFMITHCPGYMFVSDRRVDELAAL